MNEVLGLYHITYLLLQEVSVITQYSATSLQTEYPSRERMPLSFPTLCWKLKKEDNIII